MSQLHHIVNSLNIDKEKVTLFFFVFSRFEYALKRSSYISGADGKSLVVNWDKFATDIDVLFWNSVTPQLKKAVEYIQQNPPMKQVIQQGENGIALAWKETECVNKNSLHFLLTMVRRVRNNLFHGGKFSELPKMDESRDTRLLDSCLTILDACLSLHKEVNDYFHDNIE